MLLDLDAVAGAVVVRLVVRLVALARLHVLLVLAVHVATGDLDGDRLVHLVALHDTDEATPETTGRRALRLGALCSRLV